MDPTFSIPADVLRQIGLQYERGVAAAVAAYPRRSAEPEMTGTFVSQLERAVAGEQGGFKWHTEAMTFGSAGAGSSECRYGADFSIEIESATGIGVPNRKTLLVQAKDHSDYDRERLLEQCKKMSGLPGSGIVIMYSPHGFTAWRAEDVVAADGYRRRLDKAAARMPVGEMLVRKFLGCQVGSFDLRFDPGAQLLRRRDGTPIDRSPYFVERSARTVVEPVVRSVEVVTLKQDQ